MHDCHALVRHLSSVGAAPFGLISQQASPTAFLLRRRFGTRLAALLSPEHGWFGMAGPGEKTTGGEHPVWHVPVHSLYGETRKPTPEMLSGLGRLVIDLQDIGVRCYTYLATLKLALEAAADAHLPVTVADRPVPLRGLVDGPPCAPSYFSFVAPLDVPLRHGMSPGECARYIVRKGGLDVDLTVVPSSEGEACRAHPWANFVPPSPAIRSWDSALMYPTTIFAEAYTAVDCDRAGAMAFRVLGAPWLDAEWLLGACGEMLAECGMALSPYRYRPASGEYAGATLDGVALSLVDAAAFRPVRAGLEIFSALLERYPAEMAIAARPEWLDKLMGGPAVREACVAGRVSELVDSWRASHDAFRA